MILTNTVLSENSSSEKITQSKIVFDISLYRLIYIYINYIYIYLFDTKQPN